MNPADSPSVAQARSRLGVAYDRFHENSVALGDQIQKDLPGLTLHGAEHFHALWRTAELILGTGNNLNPLEVFILGGAILLHDAGNSVAAYDGGLPEVMATDEWSDAAINALGYDRATSNTDKITSEEHNIILLNTLRAIHAHRAESLHTFAVEVSGQRLPLIEDSGIRLHIGPLISKVAASHHWDIDDLPKRMQIASGSPAGFPPTWSVRPVLLACLLRCADACQLDQSRTPDFLLGLLRLTGLSRKHWVAQNRLLAPMVDQQDLSALIFTSSSPFQREHAEAWWIAHDAIVMANRELKSTDAILRDLNLSLFQINRIRGAESPTRLADHVETLGWIPVDAKIHIDKVDKIVDLFGGNKLYGGDLSVALREAIQNAGDAIRIRRSLEGKSSPYRGRITIRLVSEGENGENAYRLEVDDDGLGMSEATLVGSLIDFGGSYVSSALVRSERPGLAIEQNSRSGKYGVGFFSIFMLGDEVDVTSRPFDSGTGDVRTLSFKSGIQFKPLLGTDVPSSFIPSLSTRLSVRMSNERVEKLLVVDQSGFNGEGKVVTLYELVASLVPLLDVNVYVEGDNGVQLVHSEKWFDEDRSQWLDRISPRQASHYDKKRDEERTKILQSLDFIDPKRPYLGLAAIAPYAASGVRTVGRLTAKGHFHSYQNEFDGAIAYEADGPRRGAGGLVDPVAVASWATRQGLLLKKSGLELTRFRSVAGRIADFGGDPTPVATSKLQGEVIMMEDVYQALVKKGELYGPVKTTDFNGKEWVLTVVRSRHSGFVDNYRKGELKYLLPTIEGVGDGRSRYDKIPGEGEWDKVSFLGILGQRAALDGKALVMEGGKFKFAEYVGEPSKRDGLFVGKIIESNGLKFTLQDIKTEMKA